MKMGYNERLMTESLKGDDDSLEELKFNAGAGDCEAQYFLAMYYARVCGHLHDPNYHHWLYEDATRVDFELTLDGFSKASHILSLLSLFL